MATNEAADTGTWTIYCTTCGRTVTEGQGTPPDSMDLTAQAGRHVQEGTGRHVLELRRRGRVTEAMVAMRASIPV